MHNSCTYYTYRYVRVFWYTQQLVPIASIIEPHTCQIKAKRDVHAEYQRHRMLDVLLEIALTT